MTQAVAVILARGGSRGIKRKNLVDFCGKPLLAWSIEQALAARRITSVWVSSDDDETLKVARAFGAATIVRPARIANDVASSESGWLHALEVFERDGVDVDLLVTPQCTSPLRTGDDFDGAIAQFEAEGLDSLFSANAVPDLNLWRPDAGGTLDSFTYNYRRRGRRQEKGEQFLENGSFWLTTPALMRQQQNRLGGKIGIWPMPYWKSFQIDEPEDLELCAAVMRAYLPTPEAAQG